MENIIEILNFRYATKKFDINKKISEEDFETLLEALRLSPSSLWIQPWKFIVVNNKEIRQKLQDASWNQSQVTDASHYIVFTIPEIINENWINRYFENISSVRWVDISSLEQFKNMVNNYILPLTEEKNQNFSAQQVYIALWNILTVAAILWIDTCTIWWLDPNSYDEILWLKQKWYKTVVACALWYRASDDKYAMMKKVRFPKDEMIEIIK